MPSTQITSVNLINLNGSNPTLQCTFVHQHFWDETQNVTAIINTACQTAMTYSAPPTIPASVSKIQLQWLNPCTMVMTTYSIRAHASKLSTWSSMTDKWQAWSSILCAPLFKNNMNNENMTYQERNFLVKLNNKIWCHFITRWLPVVTSSWLNYLIPIMNSDLTLQTTCGRGASGTDKWWLSDKIKTLYMDDATVLQNATMNR